MTTSLITMSIVGFITGFIFSMPIAGPISILITSNALKGKLRYCNLAASGASFADFIYVFAAVYGLANFYALYKPVIPYILLVGTLFLLYIGFKIARTKIDERSLEEKDPLSKGKLKKDHGGLLTGFLLNFLNPTLFLNWLTSSFIVISLVASLGFDTGGLYKTVSNDYNTVHRGNGNRPSSNKALSFLKPDSSKANKEQSSQVESKSFSTILCISYAFFLSLGGAAWFFILAYLLTKHRQKININVINRMIQVLGYGLCFMGLFLGYKAIHMFI